MLSYNHDHLAWKQRVRREIITSNDFYDYLNSSQYEVPLSRDSRRSAEISRSSVRTSSLPATPNIMRKIQELEAELQAERIKTLQIEEQLKSKNFT